MFLVISGFLANAKAGYTLPDAGGGTVKLKFGVSRYIGEISDRNFKIES